MKCLYCSAEFLGDVCEYCGSEAPRPEVRVVIPDGIDRGQIRENLIKRFEESVRPSLQWLQNIEERESELQKKKAALNMQYLQDCKFKPAWRWLISAGVILFWLLLTTLITGGIVEGIVAGIIAAPFGCLIQLILTKIINRPKSAIARPHRENAKLKFDAEMGKIRLEENELMQKKKEAADSLTFIPEKYRNSSAIDELHQILKDNQADNLKEAFNYYETQLHRQRVKVSQQQQLDLQQQQVKQQQISNNRRRGCCGCFPVIAAALFILIIGIFMLF